MELVNLPTEILTAILSKLDVPSAVRCQLVCKKLNQVASSEVVLKTLCYRIGFLNPGQTLEDLRRPLVNTPANSIGKPFSDGKRYSAWQMSGRAQDELESYKTLLVSSWKLHHTMERADLSYAGGTNYAAKVEPWRIKFDHISNTILATSASGPRLHAINMHSGDVLTESNLSIRAHTHLEADQGWLAYTLNANSFQISRLERDTLSLDEAVVSGIPTLMDEGRLSAKHPVSAYRLIFPHLLVGSSQGYATVYDVTTKQVILDIALNLQPPFPRLRYVEFDQDFIWVALAAGGFVPGSVQTYCRRTGRFLWDLSPKCDVVQGALLYRFPPSPLRSYDDDPDPEQDTSCAPGRHEQFVDFYRFGEDEEEEREVLLSLDEWDAVHPDPKTGSLCLLCRQTLVVIPNYKNFVKPADGKSLVEGQQPVLMLHDESHRNPRKLPSWMRHGPNSMQSYLAVADGRAAFVAQNGVALVDLEKFLGRHGPGWHDTDDPRGRSIRERSYYESKCVNVYTSPYVFKSNMVNSSWIALTSTHLAWVGTYQSLDVRSVPEELREEGIGCEKIYASEQRPTVIWIDFAKLRDKEQDVRRVEEESSRIEALKACQAELDRRIAAAGNGKYTLASGREIKDIYREFFNPMDAIALLLNLNEFADLGRWIDWDKIKKEKDSSAAVRLSEQVSEFEENDAAANFDPLNPPMRWDHLVSGPGDPVEANVLDWQAAFAPHLGPQGGQGTNPAVMHAHLQHLLNMMGAVGGAGFEGHEFGNEEDEGGDDDDDEDFEDMLEDSEVDENVDEEMSSD